MKRLVIWLAEASFEALLLGVVLVSLFGHDAQAYIKDVAVNSVWVGTMFFSTGFLFTTGVARAVWQPGRVWLYSVVATLLFLIHLEILNFAAGGVFDPPKRVAIRIAGVCVVAACTFAGTLTLRKWAPAHSKIAVK